MKPSKLFAVLALAGFCGASETQARSHKGEVRHLEKERAHYEEAYRESKDRLRELNCGVGRRTDAPKDDEDLESSEDGVVQTHGNWDSTAKEVRSFNWTVKNRELIRERELEAARMREAAREMARIDKAIKKARERRV